MQPKPGQIKALTESEELRVIADISLQGPEIAVLNFISASLGGLPGDCEDVADFLSSNAEVASRAAAFVWRHLRHVDDEDYAAFEPTLRNQRLLTVSTLDDLYKRFQGRIENRRIIAAVKVWSAGQFTRHQCKRE